LIGKYPVFVLPAKHRLLLFAYSRYSFCKTLKLESMKIIRYLDPQGHVGHAAQQPDGTALAIAGDIFAEYSLTDRRVEIAKLLAPIQHPGEPIWLPTHLKSDKVDYECELAVVIGKAAKNVSRADALDYVLGYTCANDISARDWQKQGGGGQWSMLLN
jgi:hypothetical protein